jgi:zinc protease
MKVRGFTRGERRWAPAVCSRAVVAAVALLLLAAPASAQSMFKLDRYRLDNGLEVIVHEDHSAPLAFISVWYHYGSGDGQPGKSGLAHLAEHLMFEGSRHVQPGQHFQVLGVAGNADANATTSADRTNYFETVPANQLETALWLESDRMSYLVTSLDPARIANQRDVVRNERRQRYENVAFGAETFAVGLALYPEGHPYRYLTIGLHEDIQGEGIEDLTALYKDWYGPGNATLLVAGDVDPVKTRELVQHWFGTLPGRRRPAHPAPAVAPVQLPVRKMVNDPFTKLRRVRYVWPSPPAYSDDDIGLQVLASVLGSAPNGRLYRRLVVGAQPLAQNVGAVQAGRRFSGEFHVAIDLRDGIDAGVAEAAMRDEVERLQTQLVDPRELRQVLAARQVAFVAGFESLSSRGEAMQAYNHYRGDPDSFNWELARARSFTPLMLNALANKYLGAARAEIITLPGAP